MSTFSWLDTSDHQQQKILDVINLFRDKDTRDELGFGLIRDAFADLFAPGTSTIQTRARYFLFIPWIYLKLEQRNVASKDIGGRAWKAEINLISKLLNNQATQGLIGVQARSKLKRLPSTIYWQGLGTWGIRLFPGARAPYHRSLDSFYASKWETQQFLSDNRREDEINELHLRKRHNWHPGILDLLPNSFPDDATFDLTFSESSYLSERIINSKPNTLLALLASRSQPLVNVPYPWEHPEIASFPGNLQRCLNHAKLFSLTSQGVALIYNLMLAEKAFDQTGAEHIETYREKLKQWSAEMVAQAPDLNQWDWQQDFWQTIYLVNPHIPEKTRAFVNTWLDACVDCEKPYTLADNPKVRLLITERERRLKRSLARLSNPRSLELWGGASGTGRLNYRWNITQTLLEDIHKGFQHA